MKFARFAQTFCWNIGAFGANLCELFPDLRIRHSKIEEETSKLGARMNRFDRNDGETIYNESIQVLIDTQDKLRADFLSSQKLVAAMFSQTKVLAANISVEISIVKIICECFLP